jgi:hypothetical protein
MSLEFEEDPFPSDSEDDEVTTGEFAALVLDIESPLPPPPPPIDFSKAASKLREQQRKAQEKLGHVLLLVAKDR